MGWFAIYGCCHGAVGSGDQDVEKGNLVVLFFFHGELDVLMQVVDMMKEDL